MNYKHGYLLIFSLCFCLLFSCSKKENVKVRDNNIIPSVVADNFNLTSFRAALDRSNLRTVVSAAGPYTVLVPSDAAFIAAGFNGPTGVTITSQAEIIRLTGYHILEGAYELDKLPFLFNQEISSYGGGKLYVTRWIKEGDTIITVNGSRILSESMHASNGIIEVIDRLLQPYRFDNIIDAIAADRDLSLFYQAIQRAGLADQLRGKGPYTIFAPVNAAMTAAGYATLETINSTDPVVIATLVKYHIAADRRFLNDYVLSTGSTATSTQTMLDNNTVKITLIPNSSAPGGYEGITLLGTGNGGVSVQTVQQDRITGNGVLHTINSVLKVTQ
ncbi:fasciclin domain-containing protein [Chitinophaga niabensis]|uniref:fasciclin domain-containing protein n=1 Tax=Chitinophaga niabensis TaxID=536979 RepID=UPI0031B9FE3C